MITAKDLEPLTESLQNRIVLLEDKNQGLEKNLHDSKYQNKKMQALLNKQSQEISDLRAKNESLFQESKNYSNEIGEFPTDFHSNEHLRSGYQFLLENRNKVYKSNLSILK